MRGNHLRSLQKLFPTSMLLDVTCEESIKVRVRTITDRREAGKLLRDLGFFIVSEEPLGLLVSEVNTGLPGETSGPTGWPGETAGPEGWAIYATRSLSAFGWGVKPAPAASPAASPNPPAPDPSDL